MTDDDVLRGLEDLPGWADLVAAGRVAPPATAVLERSRSALGAAAEAQPPRRARRRLPRLGLATAVAAAVAVAGTLWFDPAGPSSATAAVAERLANVAASVPGDTLEPGQYRLRVEEEFALEQRAAPRLWRSESWTAVDGSTWRRDTYADGRVDRHRFPDDPLPVALADLPTEPRALLRRLESAVADSDWAQEYSTEHALFNALEDLLREYQAPSELRAAMIRAVGLLPHVGVQDPAVDARGRTGVGLVWLHDEGEFAYRKIVIFDPATARVIEGRTTFTRVPTVEHTQYALEHRTTLIDTSIVDELPADLRGLPIG